MKDQILIRIDKSLKEIIRLAAHEVDESISEYMRNATRTRLKDKLCIRTMYSFDNPQKENNSK